MTIPGSAKGTGLRAPASSLPHFQSVRKRPKGSLGECVKGYEIWLPTSLALPVGYGYRMQLAVDRTRLWSRDGTFTPTGHLGSAV